MGSPVNIVNQALSQMGGRTQVTSINPSDGTMAGDVASLLYQQQVDATSRSAHWNCLRYQRSLTLLKAMVGTPENLNGDLPAPPIPYVYEYALPDDCLLARFVIPTPIPQPAVSPPLTTAPVATLPLQGFGLQSTAMPFVPAVDYNTQTPPAQVRVILTNCPRAQLVYTARVNDPDLWDAGFTNAVIAVLSAWFVNPLNMDKALLSQRVQLAQALITAARVSDGNEGVSPEDHIPDWIKARWRSGGLGYTQLTPYYAPWSTISLPGGISF